MRALITNDDGVDSPGIHELARVAVEAGLDVVVAAPMRESSGASASLTAVEADGRLLTEQRIIRGLEEATVYAVEAAPAFIVMVGAQGAFGPPPDIVLSGCNRGANTGRAVLHSGTVGAVFTGATYHCKGMAISLDVGTPMHWATAGHVAAQVIPWLVDHPHPAVLNVNVPNAAVTELRGLQAARLASFGAVQTNVVEIGEGYVQVEFSDVDAMEEPGTDAAWLSAGYATVTPVLSACESGTVDLSGLVTEDQPGVSRWSAAS